MTCWMPLTSVVCCLVFQRSVKNAFSDDVLADTEGSRLLQALALQLFDDVIDQAKHRGATNDDFRTLLQKRDNMRKCFFHAVSCWK